MATTLYTAMLGEVQPHVVGAPEAQVLNAIRNAWIDFCVGSWVWTVDSTPQPIAQNVQDYVIDLSGLPTGTTIAEIMYGYFNGKPLDPITRADADGEYPNWKTTTGSPPKRFLATDAKTKVSLIPIPSGYAPTVPSPLISPGLFFTLALKPTRASSGVDDFLYERYMENVAHGAIYRMLSIPHKVWSNANLTLAHKKMFEDAVTDARRESALGFTRAALRTRPRGVANW